MRSSGFRPKGVYSANSPKSHIKSRRSYVKSPNWCAVLAILPSTNRYGVSITSASTLLKWGLIHPHPSPLPEGEGINRSGIAHLGRLDLLISSIARRNEEQNMKALSDASINVRAGRDRDEPARPLPSGRIRQRPAAMRPPPIRSLRSWLRGPRMAARPTLRAGGDGGLGRFSQACPSISWWFPGIEVGSGAALCVTACAGSRL